MYYSGTSAALTAILWNSSKMQTNPRLLQVFVPAGHAHVQKVSCEGKKRLQKKKQKEEEFWSRTGSSKQTGVEFQQCGLDWVREEASEAGLLAAARLLPPRLKSGGWTPAEKRGWNNNTNKPSRARLLSEPRCGNHGQARGLVLTAVPGVCCRAAGSRGASCGCPLEASPTPGLPLRF